MTSSADAGWAGHALILVDLQHDFWSADEATTAPDLPQRITALLNDARAEGLLVVHVRASFQADRSDWMARYRMGKRIPCISGTEGAHVLPFAVEVPAEPVVIKHSYDAFLGTSLHELLSQRGVGNLLIAGLVTSTCVLFTAATATQLGYLVSVVSDCCSDRRASHEATLANYRYVFDTVRSDEIGERRSEWNEQLEWMHSEVVPEDE